LAFGNLSKSQFCYHNYNKFSHQYSKKLAKVQIGQLDFSKLGDYNIVIIPINGKKKYRKTRGGQEKIIIYIKKRNENKGEENEKNM